VDVLRRIAGRALELTAEAQAYEQSILALCTPEERMTNDHQAPALTDDLERPCRGAIVRDVAARPGHRGQSVAPSVAASSGPQVQLGTCVADRQPLWAATVMVPVHPNSVLMPSARALTLVHA
jgi:hypothetical protein